MKVLVLHDSTFELTPAMLMRIEQCGAEVRYHPSASAKFIEDAEVIFGCPRVESLKDARALKWHHLPNAGIGSFIDSRVYANTRTILTNSRGVYGDPVAEHIVAMVFALARNFPLYSKQQREGIWERDDDSVMMVTGSTTAVFGVGDLGGNAAKRLKALGSYILGVKRVPLEKPSYIDEVFDLRATHEVLSRADFVVCCLPLTGMTRGLFDEQAFSCMNPWSYFINVGRGAIADTNALTHALQTHVIAGAALDVTDPEPLPPEHPLWSMDNVIITPHSSCVCPDVQERKLELFLKQLDRYRTGKRLKNIVDFRYGY